jgi:hypothetical protein
MSKGQWPLMGMQPSAIAAGRRQRGLMVKERRMEAVA